MNKYGAIFENKEAEIEAGTLYEAKLKAIDQFNVKKNKHHLVYVMLMEKEGKEVVHIADF